METLLRERPIRFLRSNQSLKSDLVQRAAFNPELPIIGLCWRSSFVNSARTVGYLNVDAMVKIIKDLGGAANFFSLQYSMTDEEIEALSVFNNVFVPPEKFFTDVASHAQHIGICDVVLTAGTLTSQLAGVFNRNTLTWGVGGWTFLGQRQYPWYPNHAALAVSPNVSKSSLVLQITKWLRVILGIASMTMSKNRAVAIIQARMSSSRLPGKVLEPLAGKPMIWHVVQRARLCTRVSDVVVATSTEKTDDLLAHFCERNDIRCHRGSLQNVLSRYLEILEIDSYDYFCTYNRGLSFN